MKKEKELKQLRRDQTWWISILLLQGASTCLISDKINTLTVRGPVSIQTYIERRNI
jgi:hypothetical protein